MSGIRLGESQSGGVQDVCFIRDERGTIRGLWLRNPVDAGNEVYIIALFLAGGLTSEDLGGTSFRIVPNEMTDEGGSFVMLGSFPAPRKQQPTQGGSPLCRECHRAYTGLLSCEHCGHREWGLILGAPTGGVILIAIGIWVCGPGSWRSFWVTYGCLTAAALPLALAFRALLKAPKALRLSVYTVFSLLSFLIAAVVWKVSSTAARWFWGSIFAGACITTLFSTAKTIRDARRAAAAASDGGVSEPPPAAEDPATGRRGSTLPATDSAPAAPVTASVPHIAPAPALAQSVRRLHERMTAIPINRHNVTGAGAPVLRKELENACLVLQRTAGVLENGVDPMGVPITRRQIAGNLSRFLDLVKSSEYQLRIWMLLGRESAREFNDIVDELTQLTAEIAHD